MIKQTTTSIADYSKVIFYIKKLKLEKFFIIPILVGLLAGTGVILSAYFLSDNIGYYVSKLWFWEWGKETFIAISNWLGGIIIVIFGLIIYKHIVMALSAPFMTPLSEKIEVYLTEKELDLSDTWKEFFELLIRGIRLNFRNLIIELAITIPLVILSLIPVINLATSILLFITQSYFAGAGNMDYTLERHFNYQDSKRFIKNNKYIAIGNGAIFSLMLFIPVVGILITLPITTIAATLSSLKQLEKEGKIKLVKAI